MSDEKVKLTLKEKILVEKSVVKSWIKDHKKSLIKGGVIAGAIAAVGGTVAAIVNRCGLPCGGESCDDGFMMLEEVEYYPSDCSEEVECTEEVEDD